MHMADRGRSMEWSGDEEDPRAQASPRTLKTPGPLEYHSLMAAAGAAGTAELLPGVDDA